MKNYSQIFGLAGLFVLLSFPLHAEVDLTFENGNLEDIQQRAAQEGKLYMVDFVAKWCLPCKWMDETTFSDPQVANYLTENYIPTKVDIDNFDGFGYKNQYNVQVLPTILIFNSKGEIVGRYEESMPPSKMLRILESHNFPENREKIIMVDEPVVTYEAEAIEEAPDYSLDSYEEEVEAYTEVNSDVPNVPALEVPVSEIETEVYIPITTTKVEVNIPAIEEDLFKMQASPATRYGYSVQVGVFADYGNILKESARFQAEYEQQTIVQVMEVNDRQIFKLLVGEFSSIEEAHDLRRLIENAGGEGITKDLSKI